MLFLSGNQRGLETHPKLSVTGYELPPRRLMARSQEGHANVETPGRLLDSCGKGTLQESILGGKRNYELRLS
jgi:hypothetical protein